MATDSMQENGANATANLLGGNVVYSQMVNRWSWAKNRKKTKSHFVKKSEIFCCVLNFEMHF